MYMYKKLTELASWFLNLDKGYWLVIPYIPEVCLAAGPQTQV